MDFTVSALAAERVADLRRAAPPSPPGRRPARWTPLLRHLLRQGSGAGQRNPRPPVRPGPIEAPGPAGA
jgi:hypothetical protein